MTTEPIRHPPLLPPARAATLKARGEKLPTCEHGLEAVANEEGKPRCRAAAGAFPPPPRWSNWTPAARPDAVRHAVPVRPPASRRNCPTTSSRSEPEPEPEPEEPDPR
jgi:hypothetical protein